MRYFIAAAVIAALGASTYYVMQLPESQEVLTFETRYTVDDILKKNGNFVGKRLEKAAVQFAPYLLIEAEYTKDKKQKQGISLWSLIDGEMVVDADKWEKSCCFQNAIEAGAHQLQAGIMPQTKTSQWLTSRSYSHVQKIPERYSKEEILRIAGIAFGEGFSISSAKPILLPVIEIETLNPEGTLENKFWNAFNGQPLTFPN